VSLGIDAHATWERIWHMVNADLERLTNKEPSELYVQCGLAKSARNKPAYVDRLLAVVENDAGSDPPMHNDVQMAEEFQTEGTKVRSENDVVIGKLGSFLTSFE
jgi:hypothetical protein